MNRESELWSGARSSIVSLFIRYETGRFHASPDAHRFHPHQLRAGEHVWHLRRRCAQGAQPYKFSSSQ